jgi:hypothetical protein
MALSSISVVGSSLALRLYRPPDIATRSPQTSGRSRQQQQQQQPRARNRARALHGERDNELTQGLLEEFSEDGEGTERAENLSRMEEGGGGVKRLRV